MELQSRLNWHGDVVTVSCPVVIAKHVASEIPALQEPGKLFFSFFFFFFPWEKCGLTPLKITLRSLGLPFNFSRGFPAFSKSQQKVSQLLASPLLFSPTNTFPFPCEHLPAWGGKAWDHSLCPRRGKPRCEATDVRDALHSSAVEMGWR